MASGYPCNCEENCVDHQMNGDRPPNGGDDSCNTNGTGLYCAGSFWYQPSENPCDEVLYVALGGECGNMTWQQIPLGQFQDTHTSLHGVSTTGEIQATLPEGQENAIVIQGPNTFQIENASPCYDMHVIIDIESAGLNVRNNGASTVNVGSSLQLLIDGVAEVFPANDNGNMDVLPDGTVREIWRSSHLAFAIIPPLTTYDIVVSVTGYVENGPFTGPIVADGFRVRLHGVANVTQ